MLYRIPPTEARPESQLTVTEHWACTEVSLAFGVRGPWAVDVSPRCGKSE